MWHACGVHVACRWRADVGKEGAHLVGECGGLDGAVADRDLGFRQPQRMRLPETLELRPDSRDAGLPSLRLGARGGGDLSAQRLDRRRQLGAKARELARARGRACLMRK